MKVIKFSLQIEAVDESRINCRLFNETETNQLNFFIADDGILLVKENQLACTIRNNKHQLKRILRSALKGNIKAGQTINCVFLERFNFLNDGDFNKFIRVDRRDHNLHISTHDSGIEAIHKIYADGSFICETGRAGYGGFIEDINGNIEPFTQSFVGGSSNLMELLAVTEGLKRLGDIKTVQINTDSRFVIRGLIQWVHFWQHNNWQTAYGRDVKYASYWQDIYRLCAGKQIELKWIKGHSGHLQQEFCHQLAKRSAGR
jgi:ribonuclease HI